MLWWLSPIEECRMPFHNAVGLNGKKGATTENQLEVSSLCVKGVYVG